MSTENPKQSTKTYGQIHRRIFEGKAAVFAIATTVAISIGGIVEIVPMFTATSISWERAGYVTPYTPLEVAGRDIYVREGCYLCHSQMVRPMRAEILRYGEWTRAAEYQYDRPFLLGSRRLGPDLQRVGGKYPDAWHYEHMRDPRTTSPGSVMPTYPWLHRDKIDPGDVTASVVALQKVGTPYVGVDEASVTASLQSQGTGITTSLSASGIQAAWDDEIVALIAYLQRLGVDGRAFLESQGGQEWNTLMREAAASVEMGWLLGLMTAVFFVAFLYWIWYAYAPGHKARLDEAALLPFEGGER